MLGPQDSAKALERLFGRQRVAQLDDLFQTLQTHSRMSIFRRMREIGYLTSFTHKGAFYTLEHIPLFDERGLWFHRDVGFSRAGTLKATLVEMVDSAQAGHTHQELQALLKTRVHNTLLGLVHQDLIGREHLENIYLYVSIVAARAAEQISRRRERMVELPDEIVLRVLLEVIHASKLRISPSQVSQNLRAQGLGVTEQQVERVFERYEVRAEKKTAGSGSRPSKDSERC